MITRIQKTKYLLYAYNFILAICGLAILVVGAVARANTAEIGGSGAATISTGADTIIAFGCVIFLIAFFGTWGAVRENRCILLLYATGLAVLMIVQIGMGISVLVQTRRGGVMTLSLEIQYPIIFESYWSEPLIGMSIDSIQTGLSCCGVEGATDFYQKGGNVIPGSCCHRPRTATCSVMESFPQGCLDRLKDIVVHSGTVFGAVAIAIAVFEFMGIAIAILLADFMKKIQQASRVGHVYSRGA